MKPPTIPAQKEEVGDSTPASKTSANTSTVESLPPNPNIAPSGNSAHKKKISEMGIEEAAAVMEEIGKKDLASIFQHFLDAGRVENDFMKQSGVHITLSDALRNRQPDPGFLKKLREFIEDASNSELERGMVIGALSEAATKETGELLILLSEILKDKNLQYNARVLCS